MARDHVDVEEVEVGLLRREVSSNLGVRSHFRNRQFRGFFVVSGSGIQRRQELIRNLAGVEIFFG